MNERDKHLSLALDALTDLKETVRESMPEPYRALNLANKAIGHVEAAANMPKPSRFKIIRRFWREAA